MFIKESANTSPIIDNVFSTVALCKQDNDPSKLNGTIGSLYDENGQLVALDSFFNHYKELPAKDYASYAAGFAGNPDFNEAMKQWVLEDKITECYISTVTTVGGSGAVSITLSTMLDKGQTILLPRLAWESYELMSQQNQFEIVTYDNFKNDQFNVDDFLAKAKQIMTKQHRLLALINDPAHNPSGYSMSLTQWEEIINGLNELSSLGPVCLLNDIAYIDYSYNLNSSRDYMKLFNKINPNVAIVVAASLSKTATSYGLRLGSAITLSKDKAVLDEIELSFKKYCRINWSNPNNSAMVNFTWLSNNNKQAFLNEKQSYIDILKKRSSLFLSQAKESELPTYPYVEGFFITIKCKDNDQRNQLFDLCVKNHIYICKVDCGLRVAICSIPTSKLDGLAPRIANLYKQCQ